MRSVAPAAHRTEQRLIRPGREGFTVWLAVTVVFAGTAGGCGNNLGQGGVEVGWVDREDLGGTGTDDLWRQRPDLLVDLTLPQPDLAQPPAALCTSCHGSGNDPAPPSDTEGNSATSVRGVGAHRAHLGVSSWHKRIACGECHVVPTVSHWDLTVPTHMNGVADVRWGPLAQAGQWETGKLTCAGTYCHGATLAGDVTGVTTQRSPKWTQVDGTQAVCGKACHSLPPGGSHPGGSDCALCHGTVITAITPGSGGAPPQVTWKDANLHINGLVEVKIGSLSCTSCHGDPQRDPSPPVGTRGETQTTQAAVGAHQNHLGASTWHRAGQCRDCHATPTTTTHSNGVIDFSWGAIATTGGAAPKFDTGTLNCAGAYCHGVTLPGAVAGGQVARTPKWNEVNGKWDACGTTCHTNPPGGSHPVSLQCEVCHAKVIASYDATTRTAVWADATLHIDGKPDTSGVLACTSCHGDATRSDPAPPKGTKGETQTTQAAVGAHQQHLGASVWHRAGLCTDCHVVPSSAAHANGAIDISWGGGPAGADGATPAFDANALTCAGAYCHGTTLLGAIAGGQVARTPKWTEVGGTWDACGTTCHTNPPGGTHPTSTQCALCHTAVIASYDPSTRAATWTDATRHIDGKVDASGTLACTSCHGDATRNPAPPKGTKGETATTQAAVGAHQQHLASSAWHRTGLCTDCHVVPSSLTHTDGVIDFGWSAPANADGATPKFDATALTCSGAYCHGVTLLGANTGGTVARTPKWTEVGGTWNACGTTCHTNPPGGTHPTSTQCQQCHKDVISGYDPMARTATWADASRHVDGVVDASGYHDLANWTSPGTSQNHHGTRYFLTNRQRDEHNIACTQCHGAQLDGGTSGVSCFASNCHADFGSCAFCHGTKPTQANPPRGVAGETGTGTLGVGRHVAHLASSATHTAFPCAACHKVPAAGDLAHALDYVPSANLQTAGHHGDVSFSAPWTAVAWTVTATAGQPVTARGTCVGACHSDGRGGAPVVTPYWAGGTWAVGSCGNCHANRPPTGRHGNHTSNMTCTNCHPAASGTSHMNGQPDTPGHINGNTGETGIDVVRNGPCGSRLTCNGRCHGKDHSNRCW